MKPQNVIQQLIGTHSGWEDIDIMAFQFYDPSKYPWAKVASVYFDKGTLTLQDFDSEGSITREEQYCIKATLEPFDVTPEGPGYENKEDAS